MFYLPAKMCTTLNREKLCIHCTIPPLLWTISPISGTNMCRFKASAETRCTKSVVERVPSLYKLGIRIELRDDVAEPLRCFDHISLLKNLDSLKCVVVNPKCRAEVVAPPAQLSSFPSNLIKLSLSGLGYLWEEMTRMTLMPNLQVLKLRCNAFEGPMWEVEKGGFPRLRFLLIEDVDLVQLKGGQHSFFHLECLRIKHCYKLEKLDLPHCESLSDIDVVDSNPLVEKEVKAIAVKIGEAPNHFSLQFSWIKREVKSLLNLIVGPIRQFRSSR